jgi:hypothetical protein
MMNCNSTGNSSIILPKVDHQFPNHIPIKMIVKVELAIALVGGTLGASILASLLHYRAMQHSANDTLFAKQCLFTLSTH